MNMFDHSDDENQFGRMQNTACMDDSFEEDSVSNRPSQLVWKPGKITQKDLDSDDMDDDEFENISNKKQEKQGIK